MFTLEPWMQRAGEHPAGDVEYFELLARTVFSAGLGPRVVASRWEAMKDRFFEFHPEAVARMDGESVETLLSDSAVIRNRRKIESVIINAQRFLEEVEQWGTFHDYLRSIGAGDDLERAAAALAERFAHVGGTSALLFLFSAGWRPVSLKGQTENEGRACDQAAATGR